MRLGGEWGGGGVNVVMESEGGIGRESEYE